MDASDQMKDLRRAYHERALGHLERLRAGLDAARRQLQDVMAEVERQDAAQIEADTLRQALDILASDEQAEARMRLDRERAARLANGIRDRRDTLEAQRVDLEGRIWQMEADVNTLRLAGLVDETPRPHEPEARQGAAGA
jgi:hypothetical protein